MTRTIRILTLLAVMIITAGHAWAVQGGTMGHISYTKGTGDGGTLAFYKTLDNAKSGTSPIAFTDGKTDALTIDGFEAVHEDPNNATSDIIGYRVYLRATPDFGYTPLGLTLQAEVTTTVQQARRRTQGDETFEAGQTVEFTPDPDVHIYSFVMPADADLSVSVTAKFAAKATNDEAISYIDASGETKTKAKGTVYVLDGTEFTLGNSGSETWYVVPEGSVAYSWTLTLYGDVHLILADNSDMTVGIKNSPINGNAISGDHALSIYSQGGQDNKSEGKLTAYATNSGINIGDSKNLTINGGQVTATVTGLYGIYANGDVTINGGQVIATGVHGIFSYAGDITLGWTAATDYIKASTYNVSSGKAVKIADGQMLKYDSVNPRGTVKLMGILSNDDFTSIRDVNLTPYGYGGYCGQTGDNNGKNLTWEIPLVDDDNNASTPMTLSKMLSIQKNSNVSIQNNFYMANYNTSPATIAPWIKLNADNSLGGLKYPVTAVTIGNGVTTIGQNAFYKCDGLTTVTIGSNVTIIGEGAFYDCDGLTAVTIPASVTTIYPSAFSKCDGLTTVTFERYVSTDVNNSITALCDGTVFNGCNNLKLILVPNEDAYPSYYDHYRTPQLLTYQAMLAPQTLTVAKNASGWSTYCHGFSASYSLSEGVTAYEVTGLSQDGKSVTIVEADNNLVAPETPLLLNYSGEGSITLTVVPATATPGDINRYVENGGTGWVFYGNPWTFALPASNCGFIHEGHDASGTASYMLRDGQFILVDENQGLAAHRCLLNVTATGAASARQLSISIDNDDTTAVANSSLFTIHSSLSEWYDLQGRKLSAKPTKKGLYINNGKKIAIK